LFLCLFVKTVVELSEYDTGSIIMPIGSRFMPADLQRTGPQSTSQGQ